MIDKFKTESKNYYLLHGKNKGENKDINEENKQIQIEKIKKVFRDDELNKKINNENEKINEEIFNLNFNSRNLESFKNFSLIKNSIGEEKLELKYQNIKENNSSSKKDINYNNKEKKYINIDKLNNNINKEDIRIKNNIMDYNETNRETDEKNSLKDDLLNVTQEQMKIFDKGVNKLYNNHKNNIKLKLFQIKHPYLHNIKLINNKVESTSSLMTKEERLLPILLKQKSILKKIQDSNISRSNSSLGKNINDSIEPLILNRDYKSEKIFSPKNSHKNINDFVLFPPYIHRNLDNKNLLENYSSSDNGKSNSKDKINLKNTKHMNFKPYTLEQYKNKYQNNNNIRIFLGGLGPNLGGEEWNKKQKMIERKKHYSDYIKEDFEFNLLNKKAFKLKNKKSEDSKTVISKKDSEFSSYESNNEHRYKIFKTENSAIKHYGIKLPLINQRFKSNNKLKLNQRKSNDLYKINQEHDFEGSEKDLKQLIKQYEEYNEKFKL